MMLHHSRAVHDFRLTWNLESLESLIQGEQTWLIILIDSCSILYTPFIPSLVQSRQLSEKKVNINIGCRMSESGSCSYCSSKFANFESFTLLQTLCFVFKGKKAGKIGSHTMLKALWDRWGEQISSPEIAQYRQLQCSRTSRSASCIFIKWVILIQLSGFYGQYALNIASKNPFSPFQILELESSGPKQIFFIFEYLNKEYLFIFFIQHTASNVVIIFAYAKNALSQTFSGVHVLKTINYLKTSPKVFTNNVMACILSYCKVSSKFYDAYMESKSFQIHIFPCAFRGAIDLKLHVYNETCQETMTQLLFSLLDYLYLSSEFDYSQLCIICL